jgi:hypothetical protein
MNAGRRMARPMVALRDVAVLSGLLAALLLSGCSASNGADGQKATAAGSIAYNGASAGTDRAKDFRCGSHAEVSLTSNLGSGKVRITVTDGAGAVVFTRTMSGPGQDGETTSVSGAPGTWGLVGVREAGAVPGYTGPYSSSFSGQYAANVAC